LSAGVITVLTAPLVWWKLDADIATARFWADDYERDQAIERLRANQTGGGSREFKWAHVREMFMDPKSWLFAALICIPNIGAHVANTFGPTLIKGFGFNQYDATLLNIPFGALQAIAILMGSYAAYRWKLKSVMLVILALFGLAGSIMLYMANKATVLSRPLALVGYYFLAFMFGTSPVVYSWAISNVGGQTKKSTM
jgi:predicted MFS family arabinose efflux permease